MTKAEFDLLHSNREHACPECGSHQTEPCPGCHCPPSDTGYGTKHINKYHHSCEPVKRFDRALAAYRKASQLTPPKGRDFLPSRLKTLDLCNDL